MRKVIEQLVEWADPHVVAVTAFEPDVGQLAVKPGEFLDIKGHALLDLVRFAAWKRSIDLEIAWLTTEITLTSMPASRAMRTLRSQIAL